MNQPKFLLSLKEAVFAFIIVLFFSCNKQSSNANGISDTVTNDSIFKWIDQGESPDLPEELRELLLQKAHSAATNSTNDSLRPKYFSKLSLAYLDLEDSLLFRTTNKQSIVYAKKANDSVTHAEAHWDLGTFFRDHIMLDSAYYNYREAHILYDAMGDDVLSGSMLYNMANAQMKVKDYTGAEINTFKAIELFNPLNENYRLHNCYSLLGSITKELKEYDKSLEYFNKAKEYLDKQNGKNLRFSALQNNIGNVYKDQGDYLNATKYYKNALKSYDSLQYEFPTNYARYLTNLSISRLKLGDTINLKKNLKVAKHMFDDEGDIEGLSFGHYAFAEYFTSKEDTIQALHSAQLAKQLAEQSTNNKRLLASLDLLTRIDPKNSFSYMQEYISISDRLLLEERQARDKFTRISFQTAEVEAANIDLARKKQIWTGVAFGVFLLGLAVYVIINQRVKNQALRFQQQQQASNQEIFDLMLSQKQKIEETKKKEQKRISEELHDGVLGKMLGARMVLTGLNKRTNEEAVEERAIAISALKDVEGEVRAISHELSHAAYQNINNFITSIKDLLQSVGTANQIEHTFEYDESFDWDTMKGDIKINLYRMVQESLQNAVKHAECKNILVSFVSSNNLLMVTITDDGKGFKTKSGKKGIGMRNIESRVGKLNGTWDINSVVDEGTTITFQIPLKENGEHSQITVEERILKKIE